MSNDFSASSGSTPIDDSLAAAIAQAKQNASKKFASNVDARRWHNAHRHPDAIGWLCNAHGKVHLYSDGGPNECSDPKQGGCDYFGEVVKGETNEKCREEGKLSFLGGIFTLFTFHF